MRLVRPLLAGALALAAGAQAQSPGPGYALGSGEMLVQLQGSGKLVRRADRITMTCMISETGDTRAEARKAVTDKRAKILTALKGKGIKQEAILDLPTWKSGMGMLGDAIAAAASSDDGEVTEQRMFAVSLSSIDQIEPMRELISDEGCTGLSGPEFALADADAADQEARDRAMADANARADRYAKRLNMSVRRIVRISESPGMFGDMLGPEYREFTSRMFKGFSGDPTESKPGEVIVRSSVSVDYVLGPK